MIFDFGSHDPTINGWASSVFPSSKKSYKINLYSYPGLLGSGQKDACGMHRTFMPLVTLLLSQLIHHHCEEYNKTHDYLLHI